MGFNNMSFNQFKKEVEQKKEQEQTQRELDNAIIILQRKRDNYAKQAKEALRSGNTSLYNTTVALLKNSIFHLKQAQDMAANYAMAKDMLEMQNLNRKFVKSLDSVMKKVYESCKAIHVSNTEKAFTKALFQQNLYKKAYAKTLDASKVDIGEVITSVNKNPKRLIEDEGMEL